jgi:quercetin dioxygenase-like cupin family protein
MKKISLHEAQRVLFDLEGYIMHSSPGLEVIHLVLQPGQVVSRHSNPFDVLACLVEGYVTLLSGDSQIPLKLFDVIEVEKNTERGFINSGTIVSRLLILKKLE